MDIRKLQRAIVDGLEDVKAQHIAVFDTEHISSLFERVIIASGTSSRQTKALAASVRDAVRDKGYPTPRIEGEENGEWIIVDCGAAVVHLMQASIREYYRLEEIWGGKPVRMKLGGSAASSTSARFASEPEEEDEAPAAPKKVATKKAPAKKAAARSPARGDALFTPVYDQSEAQSGAAKPAARRGGVKSAKATAAKSAPAKSAAAKPPARKAPARKVAVVKVQVSDVAARKSTSRSSKTSAK